MVRRPWPTLPTAVRERLSTAIGGPRKMLTIYPTPDHANGSLIASKAYWIDLLRPTDDERAQVESTYHLQLPSREELSEVELSSRVSEENGVLFLNMPTVSHMSGVDHPPSPLGFVLSNDLLVTIRYTELRAFDTVAKKCAKDGMGLTSLDTFIALVDEMVDLSADLLEGIATEMD